MASIHGGPPGSMQMPPAQYMNHMATPGAANMHPAGMPPQMHPGMRPGMQHPAQAGHMMHPQMTAGPNGMNVHAVPQMQPGPQPNIYNSNPQIAQAFQQGHPGQMFVPNGHNPQLAHAAQMQQRQQMHLAQQRQQHVNQQMMMGSAAGQQFIHPQQQQIIKAMQQQGQPIPPQMRHQIEQQQRNMMNQNQIQQGQPVGMQRQPSLQGAPRDHPNQTVPPQQHPGQQQPPSMPPQTPQNVQLQRSRPPPTSQAPASLQHQASQHQQPQPPHAQQPPETSQPPNQQGLNHPTPQSNPPSLPGTVAHQQPRSQPMPQNQSNPPQQAGPGLQQNQVNPQQQQPQQQQVADMDRQRAMRGMQQQRQLQLYQEHQRQLMLASDKLRLFCQAINDLSVDRMERDNPNQWQQRVNQAFVPDGTFRIQAHHEDHSHVRDFEVSAAVLGRYFAEYFKLGVTRMQVSVGGGNLDNMISNDEIPSSFAYYFDNGNQVIASGSLKMKFQENTAKFEVLEFSNVTYEEYVSRHQLDFLALQDQKLSPEKSKSSFKQKQTQGRNGPRMVPHEQLPASPCGEYGIFTEIRGFIERMDIMSRMRPLFEIHHNQPDRTPLEVLDNVLNQAPERNFVHNPQLNMAQQGQTQNMFGNFQHLNMQQQQQLLQQQQHQQQQQAIGPMRTPAINGLPANAYFQSPAHAHLGLSNHASPHLTGHTPPSGQQTHGGMQAPPMMAQGSHQGMSVSANASSNASPNVTGKRRRGSLAKGEMIDGSEGMGPPPPTQGGQNKVKQSPRPGKKQKGTQ